MPLFSEMQEYVWMTFISGPENHTFYEETENVDREVKGGKVLPLMKFCYVDARVTWFYWVCPYMKLSHITTLSILLNFVSESV